MQKHIIISEENNTVRRFDKTKVIVRKPFSGYMCFCEENRPILISNYPYLSSVRITKKLGVMWRKLSAEDKKMYRDRYDERRRFYESCTAAKPPTKSLLKPDHVIDISNENEREKIETDEGMFFMTAAIFIAFFLIAVKI
jgi:hypothetical protein